MEDARDIILPDTQPPATGGIEPTAGFAKGLRAPLAAALEKALSAEFQSGLVEVLQTPLEIRFRGLEECTWADFLGSVEERSCCLGLAEGERSGQLPISAAEDGNCPDFPRAWLEISPQIAFPIIDRLLGGSGREWYVPSRALTAIEQRLLHRVGELAARSLGGDIPWACLGAATELPPSEPRGLAVLAKFTLSMGRQAGALRLCLPTAMAERMAAASDPARRGSSPSAQSSAGQSAAPTGPLELSVVVQDISVTEEELAQLTEGALLVTDTPEGGEVLVRIGGIPRFYARLGASNGRKAIRITRRVE